MWWVVVRNSVLYNYIFSSQLKDKKCKLGNASFIITIYNRHLNMSYFRVIYEI